MNIFERNVNGGLGKEITKDFYAIGAKASAVLREWLDDRRKMEERAEALGLICRDNGLDPDTTTVRQIMDLKPKQEAA